MKIIVFKGRWGHMGEMSGFPLWRAIHGVSPMVQVEELPVPKELPVPVPPALLLRVLRKIGLFNLAGASRLAGTDPFSGSPAATPRQEHTAKKAMHLMNEDKEALLLLPAGEDEFCAEFAQAAPEIKNRIFMCFHQPPAWFRLHWRRFEEFDSLGGIFCLAQNQVDYFKSVTRVPVQLIRHGVRHDFFCPPPDLSIRKGNRLLFVGQWLRDFETLLGAMQILWEHRPDLHLDCVVPRFVREAPTIRRLAVDDRVAWHGELSDENLKSLYQKADLLFLPVMDATANNAMLEAMASGLPVVTTNVGGVSEYLPITAGQICMLGDPSSHAEAVLGWLGDSEKRRIAGEMARQHAVGKFDWSKTGFQICEYLLKRKVN
jgi:glycosyltransferase involved in cell wall biosynthesis